jgi:hypothetical protein
MNTPDKLYWRVYIDDLEMIKDIDPIQIYTWKIIMNDNNDKFIFITKINNRSNAYSRLGYMPEGKEKENSVKFLKNNKYKYQGNFNKKRERKEKLSKIDSKNKIN